MDGGHLVVRFPLGDGDGADAGQGFMIANRDASMSGVRRHISPILLPLFAPASARQ